MLIGYPNWYLVWWVWARTQSVLYCQPYFTIHNSHHHHSPGNSLHHTAPLWSAVQSLLWTQADEVDHSQVLHSFHEGVCWLKTTFIVNLRLLALSSLYIWVVNSIEHQSTLTTVSMSVTFIAFLVVLLHHVLETCHVKPHRVLQRVQGAISKHSQYERLSGIDQDSFQYLTMMMLRESTVHSLLLCLNCRVVQIMNWSFTISPHW